MKSPLGPAVTCDPSAQPAEWSWLPRILLPLLAAGSTGRPDMWRPSRDTYEVAGRARLDPAEGGNPPEDSGAGTERSALLLRALLGKIRLEPYGAEGMRSYYRAVSNYRSSLCSMWDPRRRIRSRVRILCNGGGGGSRTRVRKRQARGHSMLSLFSFLARPP
jgi:hypothetical protein